MDYRNMSLEDLQKEEKILREKYEAYKAQGLKLNMARGKPSPEQLDLSKDLYSNIGSFIAEDGSDVRNYGNLQGLDEMRQLFADILDTNKEKVFVGGSSSLTMMHDTMARAMLFGELPSKKPWVNNPHRAWLCPVPGYDRHFRITEMFGFSLIPIPMHEDGPDMNLVEYLAAYDENVLGIWCVPCYSNPDGCVYSEEVCQRLASMKTKAPDFKIYWDNAYMKHHLYENNKKTIPDILALCEEAGNPDRVYEFTSFSKITLAGSSVACMATNKDNMDWAIQHIGSQCIDCNKVNQLIHTKFFANEDEVEAHMRKHADILRPKFEKCLEIFHRELDENNFKWTTPTGGYFISFNARPNTATRVWNLCKECGVELTKVGACFPYGEDPGDRQLRIAPSYPSLEEIEKAMNVFVTCVKLAAVEYELSDWEK